MKATHFIIYKSNALRLKNKLEEEVYELIRKWDRHILIIESISLFKLEFIKQIDEINLKHPRCKPIKVEFYWHDKSKHDFNVFFQGTGICSMQLISGTHIKVKANPIAIIQKELSKTQNRKFSSNQQTHQD